MNCIALVVVMVALYLCGAVGDLDARTINLRQSLHLAVWDTISAQTVMDSIKAATKGDVLVCDSLVVGEGINFRRSGIDTVQCALVFWGTMFQGETDFEGAMFRRWISFKGATFQGRASFRKTMFQGETDFTGTRFQDKGAFEFSSSHSSPSMSILPSFTMKADFGGGDFWEAKFQGKVFFMNAEFQGRASFEYATFQEARFGGAKFREVASFSDTKFQGRVSFEHVTFQEGGDFWGAIFQELADFSKTTFQEKVYFGMVIAPRTIYITWPQLDGYMGYSRPNYFFLLRNFQQLGDTDGYDDCYYDFRVQARKHERRWYNPIRGLEWVFLDLTCGYGVKPFRAIAWAGSLMFLFSLIYTKKGAIELRVERQKCNGVTKDGAPCQRDRMRGTEFCPQHQDQATWFRRLKNAFYFSVGTFTTVGYGDWHPVGKYRYLAMSEGLVGWLVMALFLVTLGKKWIR